MIRHVYLNLPHRADRRRFMAAQLRLRGLSATRVDALDHVAGRDVLPGSSLELGELGLQATWVSLLRHLIDTPPPQSVEWVIVLEDDVLLYPRFRRRAVAALLQAPPECSFVQLAHLTRRSWHPSRPLRRRTKRQIEHLRDLPRRWQDRWQERAAGPPRPVLTPDVTWGAHITAIRVGDLEWILELLESAELVTDRAFHRAAHEHPGRLLRYHGQLGCQVPFASDIQHARELQRLRRRQRSS